MYNQFEKLSEEIKQDNIETIKLIRDNNNIDSPWSQEEYTHIRNELLKHELQMLNERDMYTLFKEVISFQKCTEDSICCTSGASKNTISDTIIGGGFNSNNGYPYQINESNKNEATEDIGGGGAAATVGAKSFLNPINIQKQENIADIIKSFKTLQSTSVRLNIGFDTEFQNCRFDNETRRYVLCLSMSIIIGDRIIRYFFLVNPDFQYVDNDGGRIPAKTCFSDVLSDMKRCYIPDLPAVSRRDIIYQDQVNIKNGSKIKEVNYKAMKNMVIPVTLICHAGKADISVFRRSKYDVDLTRKISEIQGGWVNTEIIRLRLETDRSFNYYWFVDLQIRDTMGLTPADHKSLKALGNVIGRHKIELNEGVIEHMAAYAYTDPVNFFEYAMNDADIVIDFCSELFLCNRGLPMTLSSAAASSMYYNIKSYLGVRNKAAYDRIYRGLEIIDDGLVAVKNEQLKFLKATRYVPITDNPDAKLMSEYFMEAYTGGFNASFYLGWITEKTYDYDLKNAYPTAMALILDIYWSKLVQDFPRGKVLDIADIPNPLIPAVAVGDVDFPDDCYCPCIPVPVKGGLKIYPRHARSVYMTGPDMYLALKLGATITINRGFICPVLKRNDNTPSKCLSYAITELVQDRALAKVKYKNKPLIEKTLKTMSNSCYGKTSQNVSPKTRYNAKLMGRVDASPSVVTSPYHAAYTTALVRCILIACINQLHNEGYKIYSVTTDGFITDAPLSTLLSIDGYGFSAIFQEGRYTLNRSQDQNLKENQVWETKHYNDVFLNITTRGNVAVNDEGVLAHNSFITGEIKGSRADRDAYLLAVLARTGKLKCPTNIWTKFADLVERKCDFQVNEIIREVAMDFDYKRCPLLETAKDVNVHYHSVDGNSSIDTTIAEFDTRPFDTVEEFLNYRPAKQTESCIKVKADLERVKVKASSSFRGYIGKDLRRKQLLSILMGYRSGEYKIPQLDGLTQSEAIEVINSWHISPIKLSDWKNCGNSIRQLNKLPYEYTKEMLDKINQIQRGSDP